MGLFTEARNSTEVLATFQERFWWFRNKGPDSRKLEDLADAVNQHLERGKPISISTLSNYEARGSARASEPRVSFLAALGAAFPEFNINWLLTGVGPRYPPITPLGETPDGEPATNIRRGLPGWSDSMPGGFAVSGVYAEAFKRLKQSCPDLGESSIAGLDSEGRQKEIDRLGDLLHDLIVEPVAKLRKPGQENQPEHRQLVNYTLAMIQALMFAIPERGQGKPLTELIEQMDG